VAWRAIARPRVYDLCVRLENFSANGRLIADVSIVNAGHCAGRGESNPSCPSAVVSHLIVCSSGGCVFCPCPREDPRYYILCHLDPPVCVPCLNHTRIISYDRLDVNSKSTQFPYYEQTVIIRALSPHASASTPQSHLYQKLIPIPPRGIHFSLRVRHKSTYL